MEQSERIAQQFEQVGLQILSNARNELYLNMRYLDLPLSALSSRITTQIKGIGTDGRVLAAHPKILADLFEDNRLRVNRIYLHTVLHCLLRHIFKQPREDAQLWRISCDIAAEAIADSLRVRSVRMGISRPRQNWYGLLKKELKVLTAEGIYQVLSLRGTTLFERSQLLEQFCIDDHSLWPASEDQERPAPASQMLQNKWQDISEKTQTQMETISRDAAQGAQQLTEQMKAQLRRRQDYRGFLRRFAVWKEELSVDPDSFDYVFYTYGLSMYGNLPLIEPQEVREVRKIEEFVLVIDVSMSTRGELVKQFLDQTYSVLTERESYLKKVHLRILQCDDQVQEDKKITGRGELEEYMRDFSLKGGGGTDFRPAFAYVRDLAEAGELARLRGMIYFTDGRGTYPKQKPPWETAFVFMEEDYTDVRVPPWAIKLIVEREQLEETQELRTDYRFADE